jgi:hypothetical protein
MRLATVWKYCEQQRFQNMTREALCIVIVLLSHQIDNAESIDSPNNGQYELLDLDSLLQLLRGIISRYTPLRRMIKVQSEPTLVPSHKSLNLVFLVSLENGQQLSASLHPNLSQTGC